MPPHSWATYQANSASVRSNNLKQEDTTPGAGSNSVSNAAYLNSAAYLDPLAQPSDQSPRRERQRWGSRHVAKLQRH